MPDKSPSEVQNVSRIRMLDPRPFILHNLHLESGKRPAKGCSLCSGRLEKGIGVITVEISRPGVDKSGGVDEEGTTPPPSDNELWKEIFGDPDLPEES